MDTESTDRLLFLLLLVFLVAGLGGCAPYDPFTGLKLGPPQLHSGMSIVEVRGALEGRVPPSYPSNIDSRPYTPSLLVYDQFLIQRDDKEYHCYSSSIFNWGIKYYFLFESDRLIKIVDPPPFNKEMPNERRNSKQTPSYKWATVDPQQRVDETMNASAIPFDQFSSIVMERVERMRPGLRPTALGMVLFIIDASIPFDEWADHQNKLDRWKRTSDANDLAAAAALVKLQMSPTRVEELLGTPITSRTITEFEYVNVHSHEGNSIESGKGPYVAIHYVENRVFSMYRGGYFSLESLPLIRSVRAR